MRIQDIERGRFYRVVNGTGDFSRGTILLGTQDDFVHAEDDDEGRSVEVTADYRLRAVVVWDPTGSRAPGYTVFHDWSPNQIEPVNFQFDGMDP